MAAAWLAFPAVLAVLAIGWGLLLEALAGRALPAALLPGAGFAALVVAVEIPGLASGSAARLATPVAVAGAVAGIVIWAGGAGPRARDRIGRPAAWPAVAALVAFALYAAPVVLTGEPAIAGYIRLDDSATFIALADHALEHGRDTTGLTPSTHDVLVRAFAGGDYPVGALLPLAIGGKLTGQDLAWLLGPYLAFLAALLAAALDCVLAPAIGRRWLRAAVAVVASASALLFGYALWGGLKELATAALLATGVALGAEFPAAAPRGLLARLREVLPVAAAMAAVVGVLSVGGVVWVAPILFALGLGLARLRGTREALLSLAAVLPLVAAASIGPLADAAFAHNLTTTPAAASDLLGNLIEPLSPLQVLGIWPSGDFRLHPSDEAVTAILLVVLAVAASLGVAQVVRRRAWGVAAYAGGVLAGTCVVAIYAWPWVDAKAYAVASPVPVLLAGIGVATLLDGGHRVAAAVAGVAVVLGVAWSDVLAYRDATLSPHDRHAELARIGERFAGDGPTLMTEFEPYGPRWFLRRMETEGAGELRTRPVPLVAGGVLAKGESADVDAFRYEGLGDYRTLVLRRSPVASRPPSTFRLAWRGRWYDVWQRIQGAAPVRLHLGLGTPLDPGAVPRCAEVRRVAAAARPAGALHAVRAREPVIAGLGGDGSGAVYPRRPGPLTTTVDLPRAGRWAIWLGGSLRTAATVAVDGVIAGRTDPQLSYGGQWIDVGAMTLSAGPHAISVRISGGRLRPGGAWRGDFPVGSRGARSDQLAARPRCVSLPTRRAASAGSGSTGSRPWGELSYSLSSRPQVVQITYVLSLSEMPRKKCLVTRSSAYQPVGFPNGGSGRDSIQWILSFSSSNPAGSMCADAPPPVATWPAGQCGLGRKDGPVGRELLPGGRRVAEIGVDDHRDLGPTPAGPDAPVGPAGPEAGGPVGPSTP